MNHETPKLAVDILLCRRYPGLGNAVGEFVAIERKYPPLGFALPGGFVDVGESVEAAAIREAKEELSMDIALVGLIGVFSDPARDPRQHVVSCAFLARPLDGSPPLKAADDAKTARWISMLPNGWTNVLWCFDHEQIITKAFSNIGLISNWGKHCYAI